MAHPSEGPKFHAARCILRHEMLFVAVLGRDTFRIIRVEKLQIDEVADLEPVNGGLSQAMQGFRDVSRQHRVFWGAELKEWIEACNDDNVKVQKQDRTFEITEFCSPER